MTVKYDERKSAELKPDDVYRAYQKQQADGTLKALAAFNRKEETARHEKQLAETGADFAKKCGYKLPVKINWASFSDDDVKELSSPATAASRSTRWRACARTRPRRGGRSPRRSRRFSCTMGPEMKLDLAGTTLNWTTSRSARNMGDFARKVLEKKL